MADKLRVAVGQTNSRRRLAGDLALRNDLLSKNQQEYITRMITHVNPYSPYLVFTNLFGSQVGMYDDDNDGLFDVTTSDIGSEFIRIQEETKEKKPFYVIDNSQVPDTIQAGFPFEVGLDFAVLDEGEIVQLWDRKTMLIVVSRQIVAGTIWVTFSMLGQVGETASGKLLAMGKPIHWGFGNTKGEGSINGNTMALNTTKKNTFVAPTVITRYLYTDTGSNMSDTVFAFATDQAMDGSEPMKFKIDLPVEFFRQSLESLDNMIMDSVANYDPATLEINSYKNQTSFPDTPTYPGIRQQLDQTAIQYKHPWRSSVFQSLNKIESIMQEIKQVWPNADVLIIAEQGGMRWVVDTFIDGGLAKYPMTYNRDVPGNGMIDIGFGINKFTSRSGVTAFLYDYGKGYKSSGDYQNFTYNGVKGTNRSREIYFVPIQKNTPSKKLKNFTYFTKSGNGIDRGMVFGRIPGITGQKGGFTGKQLMAMQEETIKSMHSNSNYNINSTVDGNQYHLLFEGVPYVDIYGIIKLTLTD